MGGGREATGKDAGESEQGECAAAGEARLAVQSSYGAKMKEADQGGQAAHTVEEAPRGSWQPGGMWKAERILTSCVLLLLGQPWTPRSSWSFWKRWS